MRNGSLHKNERLRNRLAPPRHPGLNRNRLRRPSEQACPIVTIASCHAAVEVPAIASNAAALQERSEALDAARTAAERLYNRWTELEGKQTESAGQPQS